MAKAEKDFADSCAKYQRLVDLGLIIRATMVAEAADARHCEAMREIWGD